MLHTLGARPSAGALAAVARFSIEIGLLPGSRCRFGEQPASRAVWVSPFEVVCTSLAQPEGARAVEVTGGPRY